MKRNRGRDWKARKGERRREGALEEAKKGSEKRKEGRERRRQGDGKCQAGKVDWRGASRTNDCSQHNVHTKCQTKAGPITLWGTQLYNLRHGARSRRTTPLQKEGGPFDNSTPVHPPKPAPFGTWREDLA